MEVVVFYQTFDLKLNVCTPFERLGEIKGHGDGFFASCSMERQLDNPQTL